MMGLGLGVLEHSDPYYPSVDHRGGAFGSYLAPGMEDMPQIDTIMIENPSTDGPYGAKGIGEMANNPQPPAIAAAVYDAVGVWIDRAADHARARPPCARGEGRADARGQEGRVRRGALGERGLRGRDALRGPRLTSPFRSWNGVDRHTLFPGVAIHAIGGEQVMLCHVIRAGDDASRGTRIRRPSRSCGSSRAT